jgi:hypothetical protein
VAGLELCLGAFQNGRYADTNPDIKTLTDTEQHHHVPWGLKISLLAGRTEGGIPLIGPYLGLHVGGLGIELGLGIAARYDKTTVTFEGDRDELVGTGGDWLEYLEPTIRITGKRLIK